MGESAEEICKVQKNRIYIIQGDSVIRKIHFVKNPLTRAM